ncbi:HNH endonuclease family protein [Aureispira anguillae]|uniref:HNH nuclease domain-containing protein n=1 Tax=Aureispira anguillae TaxID=2864201 RepID=A0A915YG63_9BACT|nr:hypothetical protein [Aureispira anguillae]BDS12442.1 hypothetical protein AsAng_0031650 [Aureispira anguillae]
MIKLFPIPTPAKLTPEIAQALTLEFIKTKKAVWKGHNIPKTLLKMSHQKCCYCECHIEEESKYMEVEHFCHKDEYNFLVLEWSNLLPSCKRCNTTKGNHDVYLSPIVKPTKDKPKEHLCYYEFRLYPKTTLGGNTIEVLDLNNSTRLVIPRFKLGEILKEQLINLIELTREFDSGKSTSTKRKNRIVGTLERLMREAIPSAVYSAIMATILLKDDCYQQTKAIFKKHQLWTTEFQELEQQAKFCALDLK